MKQTLVHLSTVYDVVILDAPPFVVSDASILSINVAGVVLVMKPNKTDAETAVAMSKQFQRVGANLVGVVFNQISRSGHYGGYQYHKSAYYNTQAEPAHDAPAPTPQTQLKANRP